MEELIYSLRAQLNPESYEKYKGLWDILLQEIAWESQAYDERDLDGSL